MRRGFSLVELSIVLVILGLLTGGILAGRSLIHAAQLRSVSTEYSRWTTAMNSFRGKYLMPPGDITNATSFWGDQATGTNSCASAATANGTPGTCNGSGDNIVDDNNESQRYWQHMMLAGLIEGSFTGIQGSAGSKDAVPGENVPASRYTNAAWGVGDLGVYAGSSAHYALDYGGTFMVIGGYLANNPPLTAVIIPEDAWNLDSKMDDGKPASGKIVARYWNNLCSVADDGGSATDDLAASYKLSDPAPRCALYFRKLL